MEISVVIVVSNFLLFNGLNKLEQYFASAGVILLLRLVDDHFNQICPRNLVCFHFSW